MPIIRDNKALNWEELTNRDKYLRNKDAPALVDDPVTLRELRGGAEMISQSGNVMPRAITRDKLGEDALLTPMNLNVPSADVLQVFTGYDRHLNDYLYALTTSDIIRLNTLDFLAPYSDGAIAFGGGLGGSVTDTHVCVANYNATNYYNRYRLSVYDFDLVSVATLLSPHPYDDSFGLNGPFAFDGQYFNIFRAAAASNDILVAKQEDTVNQGFPQRLSFDGNTSWWQNFTTGPQDTSITKVDLFISSGAASFSVAIQSADGVTTLGSVASGGGGTAGWFTTTFTSPITVSPSTSYRLKVTLTANGPIVFASSGGDVYPGGHSNLAGNQDWAFRLYTSVSGRTSNRIERYSYNTASSSYTYVDALPWPGGTVPTQILGYDRKFFYAYNPSAAKIVKFAIENGSIVLASEQQIAETVCGILTFNSFIYFVYMIGTTLVAVPVSV